jgi:peptide-methionine (S)-S-oxide reductase
MATPNSAVGGFLGGARFGRRLFVAALFLLPAWTLTRSTAAEATKLVPAPASDPTAASSSGMQTIVVSGGCFWGVQGVFQHVKGVESAVSGYAGGEPATANYEAVSTGRTGHAESVKITYDPHVVSAGQLLRVFFSVAHDPTQRDRQGPDTGAQYRSAIFASNDSQMALAKDYIEQMNRAGTFSRPIATTVQPLSGFYPAEAYHQDFLATHPNYPYIVINDQPKVANLKRLFPNLYRDKPKLVAEGKSSF